MFKVIWNVIKKIFGVVFLILSPLKRLFCRRKRRTSDTILPLTNHFPASSDFTHSIPSNNQVELEPWDSWGGEENSTSKYHGNSVHARNMKSQMSQEPEPEEDMDFFQDMTPQIKKSAKILVRKKEDPGSRSSISNRLALTSDVAVGQGSELEAWDDRSNAWGEEAEEDLSWQADEALKKTRRQEREKRSFEQLKKKQERDTKISKKDGFSAVRLS